LYISIARVQLRIRSIVLVHGVLGAWVLGLRILLMDTVGIVGVGIAWVAAQTLVALYLFATFLRKIWMPHLSLDGVLQFRSELRNRLWLGKHVSRAREARYLIPQALSRVPATDGVTPATW